MEKIKTKAKAILKKTVGFVRHPFVKENEPMLHTVEWVFVLLAFFIIGLSVAYFQISTNFLSEWWQTFTQRQAAQQIPEAEKKFIGETVPEPVVDTTGWDTYRNQYYGFEIKHPDSWTSMSFKTATTKTARYETVYKFRKDQSGENDPYVGFDVAVYPVKKAASVADTNDVQKKSDASEDTSSCQPSQDMTLGEENNVFQKVNVKKDNVCFEPAYFFSIKKDNYLYDIVPVAKEGAEMPANPEQDVAKNFPEYKQAVASFKNIAISRPLNVSKATSRPAVKARRLSGGKVIGGRIVCASKHDKPRKSRQGKGHHMDEDCCIDPDESPNPLCSY